MELKIIFNRLWGFDGRFKSYLSSINWIFCDQYILVFLSVFALSQTPVAVQTLPTVSQTPVAIAVSQYFICQQKCISDNCISFDYI